MTSTSTALLKPELLQVGKFQLTSPIVHIGSEVSKLNPFEYVATSNRVYFPDQNALAQALQKVGKLTEFIRCIEQRDNITTLLKNTFGEDWLKIKTIEDNPVFPEHKSSQRWTQEKITDLRPMIRNGFGQLYIPGSSIKGAIRTAIAYHLLKYAKTCNVPTEKRVSSIEAQLRQNLGDLKYRAKFIDDSLFMDELFTNYGLTYQGRQVLVQERPNPNTDIMRAIHVTDTAPIQEIKKKNSKGQPIIFNQSVVAEVLVTSHFSDDKAKYRASIYAEMVRNAQVQFEIVLDPEMLSWFKHRQGMKLPFQSLEDLLKICREFAQDQWDGEHDYWQNVEDNARAKDTSGQAIDLDYEKIRKFYQPERCPYTLRLGWGSGMTGTTVGSLLSDELRSQIRDTCGIAAPNFESPKSRRTVTNSDREIQLVPGWVKFNPL